MYTDEAKQRREKLASNPREDTYVLGANNPRLRNRPSRATRTKLPFRDSYSWSSVMRCIYRAMGGQKVSARLKEVRSPIDPPETLFCKSKVKRWAYHNALTLIFLSSMFIITWIVMVVIGLWLKT